MAPHIMVEYGLIGLFQVKDYISKQGNVRTDHVSKIDGARCMRRHRCTMYLILPASSLRNLTTLQPVKINALRKSRALIGCCHNRKTPPAVHVIVCRYIPLVITMVTHALCLDAF
jgi:hypothetical protein